MNYVRAFLAVATMPLWVPMFIVRVAWHMSWRLLVVVAEEDEL